MKLFNTIRSNSKIAAAVVLIAAGISAVTPVASMASNWQNVVNFYYLDEYGNYSGDLADGSWISGNIYDDNGYDVLAAGGVLLESEEAATAFDAIAWTWRSTAMTYDQLSERVRRDLTGTEYEYGVVIQAIANMPKQADAYANPCTVN